MASIESDGPDVPACPFLGLAADPRSHFTYPHPSHRCFAREHPATTDARRQLTYCLSAAYPDCDRYQAEQRRARAGKPPEAGQGSRTTSGPSDDAAVGPMPAPGTVVHVLRPGDSLAKLATIYGLTVEQIATANSLNLEDGVPDGTRVVIPLRDPRAQRARGESQTTTTDRPRRGRSS